MMKLTKREIFWLAHKYAKRLEGDYKARFNWSLKYIYNCIKLINSKNIELKGSPKQVKWANEIRENFDFKAILFERYMDDNTYHSFNNKILFINLIKNTENASFIIAMYFQTPATWFCEYVRYINGETKVMEVGKEYDSSFFTIDEQGRFLQCEWNGTLRKKQYFNY